MKMTFEDPAFTVCRGDSIAQVKEKLGLKTDPQSFTDTGDNKHVYHMEKHGFWIFFDEAGLVYSIRFENPYQAPIEGIHIGDSKEQVLEVLGKPHRYLPVPDSQNRWIYDKPAFLRIDFNNSTNRVEKVFR